MSLKGTRVLDLTRIIAGPFCTQLLGDLGADVIKVETPSGDPMRAQGTVKDGMSWYFAGFNRNKRSVALDLRQANGMAILREMIAKSDVLVENFKAGTLAKMGLSDSVLKELNPRLIVCHISGFGADGPYADRPAFDFVVQAMSGFMWTNGRDGDEPLRSGLPISDLVVGLYGGLAVSAGLAVPRSERVFNSIDISLMDGLVSLLAYMGSEQLATGAPLKRSGNDHPLVAPYGLYRTADSHVAVAPSNEIIFDRLLIVLGRMDLKDDPRFVSNDSRMRHRAEIRHELEAHFRERTSSEWIELLNKQGVPAGAVNTVEEALNDPQVKHRNMVVDVEHPGHGNVRMMGSPIKQSSNPDYLRYPAPDIGQHTEEVLREFGYSASELEGLRLPLDL